MPAEMRDNGTAAASADLTPSGLTGAVAMLAHVRVELLVALLAEGAEIA